VGPRDGRDRCGKYRSHRDSIPDRPACSSVVIATGPTKLIYICLILGKVNVSTVLTHNSFVNFLHNLRIDMLVQNHTRTSKFC